VVITLSAAAPAEAPTASTAAADALKKAGTQVAALILTKAQDAIKAENEEKKDVIAVPADEVKTAATAAEPAAAAGAGVDAARPAAGKPVNKPANKPANKPTQKPANKPANKQVTKPANKPTKPAAAKAGEWDVIELLGYM
jgi:hypothetical protein